MNQLLDNQLEATSYLDTFERPEILNLNALLEEYFQPVALPIITPAPTYTRTYNDELLQDRLHEKLTDPRLTSMSFTENTVGTVQRERRIEQRKGHPMRRQGDQVERVLVS